MFERAAFQTENRGWTRSWETFFTLTPVDTKNIIAALWDF